MIQQIGFCQENSGLVYHKTDKESLEYARAVLNEGILKRGSGIFYDSTFICGPLLWEYVESSKEGPDIKGIPVNFNVPVETGYVKLRGCAIQKRSHFSLLWNFVFRGEFLSSFSIRLPNSEELNYYWSIIPYEIEEPIFVVEFGKLKVLVDFVGEYLLHFDLCPI